jgi:hypothetical protein
VVEVMQAVGNAAMRGALATVIVAYINARRSRKAIITTNENTVVHVEGISTEEIEWILTHAKNLTAFDPDSEEGDHKKAGIENN